MNWQKQFEDAARDPGLPMGNSAQVSIAISLKRIADVMEKEGSWTGSPPDSVISNYLNKSGYTPGEPEF